MILRNEEAQERFDELTKSGNILGMFIVGSQSYGTNIATSDIDKQFIYIEPLERILNNTASTKIELTKDFVGFEIGRFLELIMTANPSVLDLTVTPADCIEFVHPLYQKYIIDNSKKFLTKRVRDSYGKYAEGQIKKARGENKKFRQTFEKERKGLLDFCWVGEGQGSELLKETSKIAPLKLKGLDLTNCAVTAIDHMKNCFYLFATKGKGVVDKDNVQILLSETPKDFNDGGTMVPFRPLLMFYCNIEGFQTYCKDYKGYWEWEANKNEDRFNQNIANGCLYDSKNMAHCHRLLDTAIEILRDGVLNIRRPNKDQLIAIRHGEYPYEQLIEDAQQKSELINELVQTTKLPEEVGKAYVDDLLLKIRTEFYKL